MHKTFEFLYHYKILPRAGGLDDQDPLWVEDMMLCGRLLAVQMQPVPEAAAKALEGRQHGRRG